MSEKELSDKHKAFVDIYLNNGRNATKAYEAVYKTVNEETSQKLGSRLRRKVEKTAYFIQKSEEIEKQAGVSFHWAVEMNKKILENAMEGDWIQTDGGSYNKKDRMAALKGVKQITDLFGWEAATKRKLEIESQGKNGAIDVNVKFN